MYVSVQIYINLLTYSFLTVFNSSLNLNWKPIQLLPVYSTVNYSKTFFLFITRVSSFNHALFQHSLQEIISLFNSLNSYTTTLLSIFICKWSWSNMTVKQVCICDSVHTQPQTVRFENRQPERVNVGFMRKTSSQLQRWPQLYFFSSIFL